LAPLFVASLPVAEQASYTQPGVSTSSSKWFHGASGWTGAQEGFWPTLRGVAKNGMQRRTTHCQGRKMSNTLATLIVPTENSILKKRKR
jgi:hypothetical protein